MRQSRYQVVLEDRKNKHQTFGRPKMILGAARLRQVSSRPLSAKHCLEISGSPKLAKAASTVAEAMVDQSAVAKALADESSCVWSLAILGVAGCSLEVAGGSL
jgi:hypothetical protein